MVVFIDYLTLLAVPKSVGDWRDVARLSADLKRVAERYAIPVVTGSQVNRSAIGQELPDAGHLSQADSVGQDADVVIALARPALDVLKMGLIKNRHGPDGIHWFTSFRPAVGDLQEITGDEAERRIQKAKELP
jgi:replicative DNA helicase